MFYFDASKFMTKREFDEFVEVEKQLFNDSKNSVIEEYLPLLNQEQLSDSKEYDSFRKSYRKCIIDMFNRVIKYFDKYFKVKYMVLLEGSYGRDSDRICSDLDYTLVYDEDKDNYMVTLEELMNLSFSKICDISRDKVHSIFTYTSEGVECSEEDNDFLMEFVDGEISYKCRENTMEDVVSNMMSKRDYKTFIDYIEKGMKEKCDKEWIYSFKIMFNSTDHDFCGDLAKLEKTYVTDIFDYNFTNKNDLDKTFTMAKLKKVLKYDYLENLYYFVSKIRKINVLTNEEFHFLNIGYFFESESYSNILGKDNIDKMFDNYNNYMFYINKFERLLNKLGLELSSHSKKIGNYDSIVEEYKKLYNADCDIFEKIINIKNEMTNYFNFCMEKVKEKYMVSIFTFPCAPREKNNIVKCLQYLMVDYLGKVFVNTDTYATYNILGVKNNAGYLSNYQSFLKDDWKMSFDNEMKDDEMIDYSLEIIKDLISKKYINIVDRAVYECDCGMVELCINENNTSYLHPDLFDVNENGEYVCKKCGTVCKKNIRKSLVLNFDYNLENVEKIELYPKYAKIELLELAKNMNGKELLVSRNRDTGVSVEVEGTRFNIDVEFVWIFMFLKSKCNSSIALTSHKQLFSILVSFYLNNLIYNKNISYLALPYVKETESSYEYDLPIETMKAYYLINMKLEGKECYLSDGYKKALSKQKTMRTVEDGMYRKGFLNSLDANMYNKLCSNIKKRQNII